MDDGKLVGMVSRADLVRKLAEVRIAAPAVRPDSGALQKAIWDEIKAQPWLRSGYLNLTVKDGVVEIYGAVDSDEQRHALRVLVEGVSGVRKVENKVTILPKTMA
jgi:osmotically-inducible protein OsmY